VNGKRSERIPSGQVPRPSRRGRRGFLGMMGGTGAALLAAACGGSNNKSSGAATTVATRAAATTAATAAGTAAAARTTPAAPVKVSTVTYFGIDVAPEETAWHKKFNDDFAAAFPQYRAEDSEYANGTDFYPKLQTAIAANSPPDFIFRDSGGQNLVTLWDQGLLAPLNDVMDDVYKSIGGKDKFSAGAVDRFTYPSGDVIGVPFNVSPFVLWFRQDLLQEAGLTPPAGHWDWNFLLKAVKAVHKPPSVYGIGIPMGRNTAALQYGLGTFIFGNGGHFVSQDLKDVVFDSPEVKDSIDLLRELSQYTPPGATTWINNDQINAIVQGNVAMGVYLGRVFFNLVNMNPSLIGKLSNTLVPYNKDPRGWGGYGAHGLFKGAKNPQGAKELMKFSMRKEQYISYLLVGPGGSNPAIPSYGADPSYIGSPVLKAFDPKMLATMAEGEKSLGDFVKEGPSWKTNGKAGTLTGSLFMADVVQKVVIGKESTQSAVTFGAQQIRDIMKG
jgi:ABC-type glycerol-3-phosphate transport system substrate-binding protein